MSVENLVNNNGKQPEKHTQEHTSQVAPGSIQDQKQSRLDKDPARIRINNHGPCITSVKNARKLLSEQQSKAMQARLSEITRHEFDTERKTVKV